VTHGCTVWHMMADAYSTAATTADSQAAPSQQQATVHVCFQNVNITYRSTLPQQLLPLMHPMALAAAPHAPEGPNNPGSSSSSSAGYS
jgi:hypothetical protein